MITVGSEKLSSNIRRKLRMTLAFQKRVFSFFFLVIDLKINKGRVASLLLLKKKKKKRRNSYTHAVLVHHTVFDICNKIWVRYTFQ